jgi:two-component system nitrogen regulation response regulator NtrX
MLAGRFRQDLYFRLNVFPLTVPPLRERAQDIAELIEFFSESMVEEQNLRPVRLTAEAMQVLQAYAWPGNVRELKNFVERIFILYPGREVEADMLPPEYRSRNPWPDAEDDAEELTDFKEARARFEERFLRRSLARSDGNITRMAETIGLERTYLYRKLKSYGISVEEGRSDSGG